MTQNERTIEELHAGLEQGGCVPCLVKLGRKVDDGAVLWSFMFGAIVACIVGTGIGLWFGFTWDECENSISEDQAFVIAAAGFAVWIVVIEQMLSSSWLKERALESEGIRIGVLLPLVIAVTVLVGVTGGAAFPADRVWVSVSSGLGAGLLFFFLCWPWGPKRSSPDSHRDKPAEHEAGTSDSCDSAQASHQNECECRDEIEELKKLIEERLPLPPQQKSKCRRLVEAVTGKLKSVTGSKLLRIPTEVDSREPQRTSKNEFDG